MTLHDVLDSLRSGWTEPLGAYCDAQHRLGFPDDDLATHTLGAVAQNRWPQQNLTDIAAFARDIGDIGVVVSPLFAEAVIRASLGETHLTRELPAEYRFPWTVALINAVREA